MKLENLKRHPVIWVKIASVWTWWRSDKHSFI